MNAPTAPDPKKTINQQTQSNIDTATAQTNLNAINQITPTGSLTYKIIGTNPDGTPKYQATSALNPQTQALLNSGQQGAQKLLNQINAGTNVQTLSQQTQSQLDQLASQRLDPMLAKQQASLEQQLRNQGIAQGSEAWNNALTLNGQNANDARNQLILQGYTTANNAALNQSNLPYSQLASLMGSQQPNINQIQTPTSGIAPVDTAAITQDAYKNSVKQANGTNGALGAIAGTVGGWLFSDERLKEDIGETGWQTGDGIPVKSFRYSGSPIMNIGVMAQDAERIRPDAVATTPSGFKAVNYDKLRSPMLRLGRGV